MNRGVILGLLAAMLVALALRCPELDRRPMHNDEAVNAIKFRALMEEEGYQYDPNEHHGPTLFYFTLAWTKLTGVSDFAHLHEARLRGLTVLFGVGLILLLPLVADGLGRGAVVFAGFLTALSPAMVYYSRDYIHETVFLFFTFLALAAGWRFYRNRTMGWAMLTGAAVGLMQGTKETFVLALAAMLVALGLNALWEGRSNAGDRVRRFPFKARHVLAAATVWIIVAFLFFSSFLSNPDGPLNALRTYSPWFDRAAGNSPHLHPWYFYFERLLFFHVRNGPVWSEALILVLALAGFSACFARKGKQDSDPGFLRFLALYTLTLTAIYSFIPYKTPWCLLGFWHGMILLAGVGAVAVFQRVRRQWMKAAIGIVLLAGGGHLAKQAWEASVKYPTDRGNPYVYAQTSPNLLELVDDLKGVAAVYPGRHMVVKVMAPDCDYWPLPWYLRAFDQVGWWSEIPEDPFAPVMVVSTKLNAGLDKQGTHIMAGLFELRPDVFLELYVKTNLWRAYLEAKGAGREDHP
jgi:uncharacterized protein (TIGR03663 family)